MIMTIKITHYSETIDNWGRTESSSKGEVIRNVLTDTDNWNDDMKFEDENGKLYFIDDLIGKEVEVEGIGKFTVPDEE